MPCRAALIGVVADVEFIEAQSRRDLRVDHLVARLAEDRFLVELVRLLSLT